MIDDCSGVAGRTSRCNKKAEMARECPDLTHNFDQCWAAIQAIVFQRLSAYYYSRTNIFLKTMKNCDLAHQSDLLLTSSKLGNLHAASRFAQNEFKKCILDPKTNELCFKGKITR